MQSITLLSGERTGIGVDAVPESESIYCNVSYDIKTLNEVDVGIHIWAENLIENPNPHKNEEVEFWESWISLENYDRLVSVLEEFSYDSYDDVNQTDIAYTPCTSHGAICFVCDEDLSYREDVLSITQARGPIYCHEDCVKDFYKVVKSVENEAPEILSRIV